MWCWGRCGAQAGGGGGEQEGPPALSSPSLAQPPLSVRLSCGSCVAALMSYLLSLSHGSLHLLPWTSGSHCLSVCLSGRLAASVLSL